MPDSQVRAAVRRPELRDFLRNRRSRITPAEMGLPTNGRRRSSGLRREEVAVLAGIGPSWYQWLEQGRDIAVSAQVLDAVARVLRLDDAERRHLYVLAELNPPSPDAAPQVVYCEGLQRLIDAWDPNPATMLDRHWNHVAWNESARLALGAAGFERNCLVGFFQHERYRRAGGRSPAWQRVAPMVVAAFRAVASEHREDRGYQQVIDELLAGSPEFADLWVRQDVQLPGVVVNEVEHPVLGTLIFESSQLQLPARPDLTVVFYNPLAGTDTAAKVRRLLAGAGESAPQGG